MQQGAVHVASEVRLPTLRLELIQQEGSGPFHRTHRLDGPTITYLPPTSREAGRGCFGAPASHRDFDTLGIAVIAPGDVPLHVMSPGFNRRDILVCHIEPGVFETMLGPAEAPEDWLLDACRDVRAPRALEALGRLLVELKSAEPGGDRIVAGYGLVLIGELTRHFAHLRARTAPATGTLAPWQLRRIEERLGSMGRPRPNLAELAALCGIGRRHLMRAFKATKGMTVLDYIEQATFARASRLLEDGDMPLKQLAAELGYSSQASFSAAFRRHFGDTPHAYRSRRRGDDVANLRHS